MALELLKDHLKGKNRALDIGSGSGYFTVLMSKLMGDQGFVYGMEHIPELVTQAKANVTKNHTQLLDDGKIVFREGDGRKGLFEFAPYNAIMYGGSTKKVPRIMDQIAVGGRMVRNLAYPISRFTFSHS